jgi:hypothetical protein
LRPLFLALSAGLAGAIGGASAFFVIHLAKDPSSAVERSPISPRLTAPIVVTALPPQLTQPPPPTSDPRRASASLVPKDEVRLEARDFDAERAELEAARKGFVSAFTAEARDPAWARSAEQGLSRELDRLATHAGFKLRELTCKTTLCKGTVEIGDKRTTRSTVQSILHAVYEPNCAIGVDVSDTVDETNSAADLRFECEQSRISELTGSGPARQR